MQTLDWDDLRIALTVGRTRSFAAAARQLKVHDSTVARRVAQLERRLAARLFQRDANELRPTQAGEEMLRRAEAMEIQIHDAAGAIAGTNNRAAGTVRVTAACLFTNHILVPNLCKLLPEHPDLGIELVADGRDLSLIDREADVAIRLMRPDTASRAIVKHIGTMHYGVYAARKAAKRPLPWIAYDERLADLPQAKWITEQAGREGGRPPQLRINDAETLLRCLSLGLGKSVLPIVVGDQQAGLVRLDDDAKKMAREVWLLVHPELRNLTRVRVVMQWLEAIARSLA